MIVTQNGIKLIVNGRIVFLIPLLIQKALKRANVNQTLVHMVSSLFIDMLVRCISVLVRCISEEVRCSYPC